MSNETGKKHLIPGQNEIYRGQCVQLIGVYLPQVFNQTLPIHPNAKDYWTYGIPGWDRVTGTPQKGDIAVYNGHTGFPEGHIAIYYDGRVFEENADPDGSAAHLAIRTNTYLLGYLRKQGGTVSKVNNGDTINYYRALFSREPDQAELDKNRDKEWNNPDPKLRAPLYSDMLGRGEFLSNEVRRLQKLVDDSTALYEPVSEQLYKLKQGEE